MPYLVEAYLEFRSRVSGDGFPVEESTEANEAPGVHPSGTVSEIELIDIFSEYNFRGIGVCLSLKFM